MSLLVHICKNVFKIYAGSQSSINICQNIPIHTLASSDESPLLPILTNTKQTSTSFATVKGDTVIYISWQLKMIHLFMFIEPYFLSCELHVLIFNKIHYWTSSQRCAHLQIAYSVHLTGAYVTNAFSQADNCIFVYRIFVLQVFISTQSSVSIFLL